MLQEIFEYPFLIRIFNKIFTDEEKIKISILNKYFNSKKFKFLFDKEINVKINGSTIV